MIAFRNSDGFNKKKPNKEKIEKNIQKLLDIIYNSPKYHTGSYHKDVNISQVIELIYDVLFVESNNSLHLIIDKTNKNSLNLTVDKID